MSMEAMLREMVSRHAEDAPKPPLFIAQALRDEAAFYFRLCQFQVGDLVTPRRGTTMKGAGEASIVIDVNPLAEPDPSVGEAGSARQGLRHDMRVLCWVDGCYAPFWVESAAFEAWVDPHADVVAPAAGTEPAAA